MPEIFLLAALAINAFLVYTLGRFQGWLLPLATGGAVLSISATLFAFWSFGRIILRELGPRIFCAFSLFLSVQLFWALFKAPVDVDGLFYHLTVILDSLQKNQWGHWSFPDWQAQNTPHFGEVNNLGLIAFGKNQGYRLAQLGQFSYGVLGALSIHRLAKTLRASKPALWALVFFTTPLVAKQMGSNYVDLAAWSTWLAAAALLAERPASLFGACLAIFLHCGMKVSGPVTAMGLFPLFWNSDTRNGKSLFAISTYALLASWLWMYPNFVQYGNPLYPLNIASIWNSASGPFTPPEMGIGTDFHGFAANLNAPGVIQWIVELLVPEAVGVYDINGGAWGFVGIWAGFACLWLLFQSRGKALISLFQTPAGVRRTVGMSVLLTFFLMPGRIIPRHGLLLGFFVIGTALLCLEQNRLNAFWRKAFALSLVLQFLHSVPDRVLMRGMTQSGLKANLQILSENFTDILRYGEPQAPGRWMHYDYVPALRRQEPRMVVVGQPAHELRALYWGRRFSNRVEVLPSLCLWPQKCPTPSNSTHTP